MKKPYDLPYTHIMVTYVKFLNSNQGSVGESHASVPGLPTW